MKGRDVLVQSLRSTSALPQAMDLNGESRPRVHVEVDAPEAQRR
jgi:hypothetical protein